jgi:hypothetical protein
VVRRAKCFNREVLTIHAKEDCEGLERVQLDDYNDYLLDPLDEDVEVSMDRESSSNTKVDDADDIQKERHRLINAKHAQSRHRAVKTNQQGNRNLHNFSTGDLRAIINAGRDARNIIIVKQQEREEVEAYSTTRNQHPPEYLGTTQKCKPEVVEQSTRRKKTPSSKKNDSRKSSTGNACTTRRASILLLNVKPFEGPWSFDKSMNKGDGTTRLVTYS